MKKRKQMLSLLLAASMVCAMFTGCGQTRDEKEGTGSVKNTVESSVASESQSKTGESEGQTTQEADVSQRIVEEPITLEIAGRSNLTSNVWNDSIAVAEYEKRLGIHIEATTYNTEQWDSKLTVKLASDDMPDMIVNAGLTMQEVEKYAADGYFLDFSEYLNVMPNLSALMEEYPEYANKIKLDNGSIYAFPNLNVRQDSACYKALYMSQKWLDNVGMERPRSLDELYDVLKAFKEQDANGNGDPDDEIPMSITAIHPIMWAYGIYSNVDDYHLMVDENGKVFLGDATENYKEFLKYVNKLYSEGLINEDCFVKAGADLNVLIGEDRVGVNNNVVPLAEKVNIAEEWYGLAGFTQEGYSTERVLPINNRVGNEFLLAANADTEYPEEIAKFVDYLLSDEGAVSAIVGYEGITFDYVEMYGSKTCDFTAYADGYDTTEDFRLKKAVANGAFNLLTIPDGSSWVMLNELETEYLYDDEVVRMIGQNVLKELGMRESCEKTVSVFPAVSYTEEELKDRISLYADVVNYLIASRASFITGAQDIDATWDSYIATLNNMGLERLIEIEQAAYDRFMAK